MSPIITRRRGLLLGALVAATIVLVVLAGLPLIGNRLGLPASLWATAYTNPVLDTDFPDPAVLHASDDWYYAYATQTITNGRLINVQVARSHDLVHWEHLGDALPVKAAWADSTDEVWAPHVAEHDGLFYMYYSTRGDTSVGMCLAVATAKTATGPFTDVGRPLRCGPGFFNIDPMAFDDPQTGKRLLYWGSNSQPIVVQELAPARVSFMPGTQPMALLQPSTRNFYERLIEGPWVVLRDGYYYLYYSGDNCCAGEGHYAVMVARSESATGPFVKRGEATGDFMGSVILQLNNEWHVPGHNAIVTDDAGQDWIVYHAVDRERPWIGVSRPEERHFRRVMLIDRVVYQDGWPMIEGRSPSTTKRRGPVVR